MRHTRTVLGILGLIGLLVTPAALAGEGHQHAEGQAPPAMPERPQVDWKAKLAPVAWMVGEWEGKGQFMGMDYTARQTSKWVFDGTFLQEHITVLDPEGNVVHQGLAYYFYDTKEHRILFQGYSTDGEVGAGLMEVDGELLRFSPLPGYNSMFEAGYRGTVVRQGENGYRWEMETPGPDGAWQKTGWGEYTRK